MAPSLLELAGAPALPRCSTDGRGCAWCARGIPTWRKSWFYYYNYEKEFPYTPNVRGIRTEEWKYISYPHGDGSPDRHLGELYDLKQDPAERSTSFARVDYAATCSGCRPSSTS